MNLFSTYMYVTRCNINLRHCYTAKRFKKRLNLPPVILYSYNIDRNIIYFDSFNLFFFTNKRRTYLLIVLNLYRIVRASLRYMIR